MQKRQPSTKKLLSVIISTVVLPEGISWYEVDSQKVFETRNKSLKPNGYIAYLIRRPQTKFEQWFKYGINLSHVDNISTKEYKIKWVEKEITIAIKKFQKYLDAYPHLPGKEKHVLDPDGGELGTGDN